MRNKNCVKCGRRFGSISRAAWFLLGEGRLWGLAAGQGSGGRKATCRGKGKAFSLPTLSLWVIAGFRVYPHCISEQRHFHSNH